MPDKQSHSLQLSDVQRSGAPRRYRQRSNNAGLRQPFYTKPTLQILKEGFLPYFPSLTSLASFCDRFSCTSVLLRKPPISLTASWEKECPLSNQARTPISPPRQFPWSQPAAGGGRKVGIRLEKKRKLRRTRPVKSWSGQRGSRRKRRSICYSQGNAQSLPHCCGRVSTVNLTQNPFEPFRSIRGASWLDVVFVSSFSNLLASLIASPSSRIPAEDWETGKRSLYARRRCPAFPT